jgi:hypothetical protein
MLLVVVVQVVTLEQEDRLQIVVTLPAELD